MLALRLVAAHGDGGAACAARSSRARSESAAEKAATSRPASASAARRSRSADARRRRTTSFSTASGSGTASGFETRTYSPVVAAIPRFTFAAKVERAWILEDAHAVRDAVAEAGRFATTSVSSTCGASTGSERRELVARGRARRRRRRSSRLEYLAVDLERPLAAARQLNERARSRPAATSRSRSASARRIPSASARVVDEDRGVAGDLAKGRLGDRDDRRPACHRLDPGRPKPS